MSTQRKLYLFAAVCFSIGAVLAVVKGAWGSLLIFAVLAGTMLWIQWRVDTLMEQRRPDEVARDRQPKPGRKR